MLKSRPLWSLPEVVERKMFAKAITLHSQNKPCVKSKIGARGRERKVKCKLILMKPNCRIAIFWDVSRLIETSLLHVFRNWNRDDNRNAIHDCSPNQSGVVRPWPMDVASTATVPLDGMPVSVRRFGSNGGSQYELRGASSIAVQVDDGSSFRTIR